MADLVSSTLFEDTLKIESIDKDGKVFQKVSRIEGETELYQIRVTLDIHSDLYPVSVDQHHSIILTSSLSPDAQDRYQSYVLHRDYSNTVLDKPEYCMYGKVFRHTVDKGNLAVSISFGGLQMILSGSGSHLNNLELDSHVYCLMRNVY